MLSFLSIKQVTLALCLATALFSTSIKAQITNPQGDVCLFSHYNRNDPSKIPEWVQESTKWAPFDLQPKGGNDYFTQLLQDTYTLSYANDELYIKSIVDNSSNEGKNHLRLFKIDYSDKDNQESTAYVYLKDNDECHGRAKNQILQDGGKVTGVSVITLKWKPGQKRH